MSFSVEKIGNPAFSAAFPENSENSGDSSKIRPSFPAILIPKAEKSGFSKNLLFHYPTSSQKSFFSAVFPFAFFPDVFRFFLFC